MVFSEIVLNAILDYGMEHNIFSKESCCFCDSRTITFEVIDTTIVKNLQKCLNVDHFSKTGITNEFYMLYFLPIILKKAVLIDSDQTVYEALKERKFKEDLKLVQDAYALGSFFFEYHVF